MVRLKKGGARLQEGHQRPVMTPARPSRGWRRAPASNRRRARQGWPCDGVSTIHRAHNAAVFEASAPSAGSTMMAERVSAICLKQFSPKDKRRILGDEHSQTHAARPRRPSSGSNVSPVNFSRSLSQVRCANPRIRSRRRRRTAARRPPWATCNGCDALPPPNAPKGFDGALVFRPKRVLGEVTQSFGIFRADAQSLPTLLTAAPTFFEGPREGLGGRV